MAFQNKNKDYQAISSSRKNDGGGTTTTTSAAVEKSPFFRPTDPRKLRKMSTPGGTIKLQKKKVTPEHKSSIFGASCNMVVSIVGAGIVGIPYAIRQSGLVSGIIMVIFCALLTEKSLRLLIETGKHVNVPSYETLFEVAFGFGGFVSMSIIMFLMSYGAMISYMMIMKDTASYLLGIQDDDLPMKRFVLFGISMFILFPLSSQRDMADLAKTSKISVTFYILIVLFVIIYSPIQHSVQINNGMGNIIKHSILRPQTFFAGLGVLSFAYVCQHSAFIIAGSLQNPTKKRWSYVTGGSLTFCGCLALIMGIFGYLGFLEETNGNVLNNFVDMSNLYGNSGQEEDEEGLSISQSRLLIIKRLSNGARAILLLCMFFVYPMDAFVSRHVGVVLLFKGRLAHEGDDHSVLARTDRRLLVTLGMIIITLLPATLLHDLGNVLAVTGAIAGSFLSYIGPGSSYLAIHGNEFIKLINEFWTWGRRPTNNNENNNTNITKNPIKLIIGYFIWYITLMPIWIQIASIGNKNLEQHTTKEALKSPGSISTPRLGKVRSSITAQYKNKLPCRSRVIPPPGSASGGAGMPPPVKSMSIDDDYNDDRDEEEAIITKPFVSRTNSLPKMNDHDNKSSGDAGISGYGTIQKSPGTARTTTGKNLLSKAKSTPANIIINKQQQQNTGTTKEEDNDNDNDDNMEEDPQKEFPKICDFLIAIFFIAFGLIAMIVGLISIFAPESSSEVIEGHDVTFRNETSPVHLGHLVHHDDSGGGGGAGGGGAGGEDEKLFLNSIITGNAIGGGGGGAGERPKWLFPY